MNTSDILWAARPDSIDANYYTIGKTPGMVGGKTGPVADAGSINNETFDLGNPLVSNGMLYLGGPNTPVGAAFSIILSVKMFGTVSHGFWAMGPAVKNRNGDFSLHINGSLLYIYFKNATGYIGLNGVTIDMSSDMDFTGTDYNDLVVTFTGTTAANGCKAYVDGVLVNSVTSSRAYDTPIDQGIKQCLNFGMNNNYHQSNFWMQEAVLVEGIIDPTANVPLVGGDGMLNGASRTAYVDLPALASSGGGGSQALGFGKFGF